MTKQMDTCQYCKLTVKTVEHVTLSLFPSLYSVQPSNTSNNKHSMATEEHFGERTYLLNTAVTSRYITPGKNNPKQA